MLDRLPTVGDAIKWSRRADPGPSGERRRRGTEAPPPISWRRCPCSHRVGVERWRPRCFTLHVFQLWPHFQAQRIRLNHTPTGIFFQGDDDPALEIRMHDWTFAH